MANTEQVEILKSGAGLWNRWRIENLYLKPQLRRANLRGRDLNEANLNEAYLSYADLRECNLVGADLSGANLCNAKLRKADLSEANLRGANLAGADLSEANLSEAILDGAQLFNTYLSESNLNHVSLQGASLGGSDLTRVTLKDAQLAGASLIGVNLSEANLSGSNLKGAYLCDANLSKADLSRVDLSSANLSGASLVETNLKQANLVECNIYGISAWNLRLDDETIQTSLIITQGHEPVITVDNIQVAQFIYLLLRNENVRHVIDTITSKVVLILGRFTKERKAVLDAVRDKLRSMDLTPILFDFENTLSKDATGTVETLARMARFIIADLTDPRCIPHELATIIPHLRTTPVRLLKQKDTDGYSMIEDYVRSYQWVLETHEYTDGASLIAELAEVIAPADEMAESFRE